jgi:hypothetical protein
MAQQIRTADATWLTLRQALHAWDEGHFRECFSGRYPLCWRKKTDS